MTAAAGRRPRPGLAAAFAVVALTIATVLAAAHGTIEGRWWEFALLTLSPYRGTPFALALRYKCAVGEEQVIGVVIADDHPIFRSGLAHEIDSHPWLRLLGEASDGREALALIRALRPQVAVVDLRMPGLSGDRVVDAITRLDQGTTILVLSAYDDQQGVFDAVAAGASGYVLKDVDRDVICDAIVCVAGGGQVLPPQLQDRLLRELRNRSARADWRLSTREREVLQLAARGLSTPQIGRSLYIGASTVKTHLERTADKLGVHGRTAAVAEAMRRGLLD